MTVTDAAATGVPADVGIIGGTGKLGTALAARFLRAGHRVVLGSREAQRGVAAAALLADRFGGSSAASRVSGGSNAEAAGVDGVVIVAVPYDGLADLLRPLAKALGDRVVVCTAVPVQFVKGQGPHHVDVVEGSACEEVAALLPRARVVGSLQNVSNVVLNDLDGDLHGDAVLTGDDAGAKAVVATLVGSMGMRAVDGGPLRNSRYVEQLTVLLLSINRRYRRNTGVRIDNLPSELLDWGG